MFQGKMKKKKNLKKIRSAKSHNHRFANKPKKKKPKFARTPVEIYKIFVWQGLAVEICTKTNPNLQGLGRKKEKEKNLD